VVCDNDPGDADPAPGVIRFAGLYAGTYLLSETQPPPGFLSGPDQLLSVNAGQVTVANMPNATGGFPVSTAPAAAENAY
jgi:hypothetical protein